MPKLNLGKVVGEDGAAGKDALINGENSIKLVGAELASVDTFSGTTTITVPASHQHEQSDINGLDTALEGKANSTHEHTASEITDGDETWALKSHTHTATEITDAGDTWAPKTHTHTQDDIEELTTTLDGKANATHQHVAKDITDGSTTWADKTHTHTTDQITGLSELLEGSIGKWQTKSMDLATETWVQSESVYTYTIAIAELTDTQLVLVHSAPGLNASQINAFGEACITAKSQGAGQIVLQALSKPTMNLPIVIDIGVETTPLAEA